MTDKTINDAYYTNRFKFVSRSFFLSITGVAEMVLGVISSMLTAAIFGTKGIVDAYFIAVSIPVLLGNLFLFSSLKTVIMSVFDEIKNKSGENEAWRYASNLFAAVFLLSIIMIAIGWLGAKFLVILNAPGFDHNTTELATKITKISLFIYLIITVQLIFGTILLNYNIFIIPSTIAAALSLLNVLLLYAVRDSIGIWILVIRNFFVPASMMFLLYLFYRRTLKNFDFTPSKIKLFSEPVIKSFRLLASMTLITAANDLLLRISRFFISLYGTGAIATFEYTYRPLVLGISIGLSIFISPLYAKLTSEAGRNDSNGIIDSFSLGWRFTSFIFIPMIVFFTIFRQDIFSFLYQRGNFMNHDISLVSSLFAYLSVTMLCLAFSQLIFHVFYAIQENIVIVKILILSILMNALLNFMLYKLSFGIKGTAIALSLTNVFIFISIIMKLSFKFKAIIQPKLVFLTVKVFIAAVISGFIVRYADTISNQYLVFSNILIKNVANIIFLGILFIILYIILLYTMKVKEIKLIFQNPKLVFNVK